MNPALIDYEGYAFPARGVGPGDRAIVWLRGCDRGCPGCMAPELWRAGVARPVEELAAALVPLLEDADGLTVSGGEPLHQATAIESLMALLRARYPVLEVLLYTGYTLAEARQLGPEVESLLDAVDIVVDGPYMRDETDELQWRGSDNQHVHLLSEASLRWAGADERPKADPSQLGVQIVGANHVRIVGIPPRGVLERYRASLAARGIVAGKRGLVES